MLKNTKQDLDKREKIKYRKDNTLCALYIFKVSEYCLDEGWMHK